MSLHEYKLPTLNDKLRAKAEEKEKVEEKVEKKEVEIKKGRRLNK